jgi:hypothetical protein
MMPVVADDTIDDDMVANDIVCFSMAWSATLIFFQFSMQ